MSGISEEARWIIEEFSRHLRRSGKRRNTIRGYISDVHHFAVWFERNRGSSLDPSAVTRRDILAYRRHLVGKEKLSTSATNRRLTALKSLFTFLVDRGDIRSNPVTDVRRLSHERSAVRVLTAAQVRRLLKEVRKSGNPLHTAMICVLACTGVMVSELCSMRMEDLRIDESGGHVMVRGARGGRRRVPLNRAVRTAIREWLSVRPGTRSGHVFIENGRPIRPGRVRLILEKYSRRAGLGAITPRVLRDTLAVRLIREAGAGLTTVAVLLGLESPNALIRYVLAQPPDPDPGRLLERLG